MIQTVRSKARDSNASQHYINSKVLRMSPMVVLCLIGQRNIAEMASSAVGGSENECDRY
jgi:hypothetical protein